MTPFRALHGSLIRKLSLRLEQLQETLLALKGRLQTVLADVLSRSLSDGIRDAIHSVIDASSGAPIIYDQSRGQRPATGPGRRNFQQEDTEDTLDLDEWSEQEIDEREVPFGKVGHRVKLAGRSLTGAAAAGLRAALLCLPFARRSRCVWLTATVAVCVGGLAFLAPSVAQAGLYALGSALPLEILAEALRACGIG